MSESGKIAVIGSETFAMGFRLAGIRNITVAEDLPTLEEAAQRALIAGDISILVMETANVQELDSRVRHDLVTSVKPTLVAVGADEDNTLRDKIKQAVGVDLW